MLEVLMTSTSYPRDNQDWRGRFIADLVESLGKDAETSLHLWAPPGRLPASVRAATRGAESAWLEHLMDSGGIAASLRRKNPASVRTAFTLLRLLAKAYRRHRFADIIHVHWLQNALPLIGGRQPLVISVLGSDFGLLRVPGMTCLLKAVMRNRPCLLAPNADWMVPRLEEAFGELAQIRTIPFGVDARWFEIKRDTKQMKDECWIVVSRMTPEKLGPLFAWFETFAGKNSELHLFGPAGRDFRPPPRATFHGPVMPRDLRNVWYPSATALITLSEHDEGRPQVILEAMAAGVPVIASDMPAHRDVITDGATGRLVSNQREFQSAMLELLDADTNQTMGRNARRWVSQHIGTWDDCARRFTEAYKEILS